jgi:hypothetical protein
MEEITVRRVRRGDMRTVSEMLAAATGGTVGLHRKRLTAFLMARSNWMDVAESEEGEVVGFVTYTRQRHRYDAVHLVTFQFGSEDSVAGALLRNLMRKLTEKRSTLTCWTKRKGPVGERIRRFYDGLGMMLMSEIDGYLVYRMRYEDLPPGLKKSTVL